GITLIESLVLITTAATALGLCAVTIQLLLRLKADGQSRLSTQVNVERLARQLRIDAHAAADAAIDATPPNSGDAPALGITLGPGHRVLYEPKKSAVLRVESHDGVVTRRELYSIAGVRDLIFQIRPEAGRPLIALVMRKSGADHNTTAVRAI